MLRVPLPNPEKWMTTMGVDGGIHIIPLGEEHELHYGCICNPIQHVYSAGGSVFTHRVLTC